MERIKIEQHTFTGSAWVAAWLFTIGFLHLGFWRRGARNRGVAVLSWREAQLAGALNQMKACRATRI
jgi:hypothetical protein